MTQASNDEPRSARPSVSVVVPLYHSAGTLAQCLAALAAQTFDDFELILVDSSCEAESAAVARSFPRARYIAVERPLLPQAARNLGARTARAQLLAFTDPDIQPSAYWLERLVRSYGSNPAIVFGPIACLGRRWIDMGAHFAKFQICLPEPSPRSLVSGWSGNVLVAADDFWRLGGWSEWRTQGDTIFSARAAAAGSRLRFEPGAVVYHDHDGLGLRGFVAERFARGREFGEMETAGELNRPARTRAEVIVLPLRWVNATLRTARAAHRAGLLADFLRTAPVVAAGLAAWYAGLGPGMWRSSQPSRPI